MFVTPLDNCFVHPKNHQHPQYPRCNPISSLSHFETSTVAAKSAKSTPTTSIVFHRKNPSMIVSDDELAFRVVLIGDSSVGKTCIVNRFVNNQFREDELNTIGAMYENYKERRNGSEVSLQIWDTAGQEKFKSLGPVYYRDAAAAILVFDLTNRQSFDNVSDWLKSFRTAAGDNALVVLVGNKNDLIVGDAAIETQASDWATEKGFKFFSTSAKTGNGIVELFSFLIDTLAASRNEFAMNVPRLVDERDLKKDACC